MSHLNFSTLVFSTNFVPIVNWPFLAFFSDFHTPWFASKRDYFSWILLFLELVESTVFRRAYLSKYLHKKYTRWQKWPLRTKVSDWKKAVSSAHCTTSALFSVWNSHEKSPYIILEDKRDRKTFYLFPTFFSFLALTSYVTTEDKAPPILIVARNTALFLWKCLT